MDDTLCRNERHFDDVSCSLTLWIDKRLPHCAKKLVYNLSVQSGVSDARCSRV